MKPGKRRSCQGVNRGAEGYKKVNVDQVIADLVKAAYVKQAQGKVRESIQGTINSTGEPAGLGMAASLSMEQLISYLKE